MMRTSEEAVQFWFQHINYERDTPKRHDLKLDRMCTLLDRLGNPHHRLKIIHIAGSKGKGSTAAFLASILQQAGYRTGLSTSPHLVDVSERAQINREPISPEDLTRLMNEIAAVTEDPSDPLPATFFEIGVALSFLHFAQQNVDFAVVEVGLGGRFDSTNVCQPLISVITSVSYDHQRILGSTLAQIAREKAGIIKHGIPTISGVVDLEAEEVVTQVCRRQQSRLLRLGRDFGYQHRPAKVDAQTWEPSQVSVWTAKNEYPELSQGLIGEHQAANATLAIACAEELQRQGTALSPVAIREGLTCTSWPARLEVMSRDPLVLLDCAHNVASAQALMTALRTSFPGSPTSQRFLIFATSQDKDLAGILRALAPHFHRDSVDELAGSSTTGATRGSGIGRAEGHR